MIWAFEHLHQQSIAEVIKLQPFIDFRYDFKNKEYHFQTFCQERFEDGTEKRCLKLFNANSIRQGLIAETWLEAVQLSAFIQESSGSGFEQSDRHTVVQLIEKYPWLHDYYQLRKEDYWIRLIALPLSEFIRYYQYNDTMLEMVDIDSLLNDR